MISFENVTKRYRTHEGVRTVLENATFNFEIGNNYGVLGCNGSGKSTLLRMVAGAEFPTSGIVRRHVRVSFPLGFTGTFHTQLSGRENASFMSRIYGARERSVDEFVQDFSELGAYYDMPLHTYSSGMMAKLAFGISLAIDFDVYLVDEVTEVGDARFRSKCALAFRERMARSDIIMVSHNSHTIRAYCNRGAVLVDGRIQLFDQIETAIQLHDRLMGMSNG